MMKKQIISGAFTAIVTPFYEDGSLNENSLRKNIGFQIQNKIDGIVALGTTGEAPSLTQSEKNRIIQIAKEETTGKTHLMVGTGSYSTKQTIENTLEAAHIGADSALIVTPYYNRPTQEGLYLHYEAVAKATPLPIVIYNVPGRTGQNLQTETLVRLANLPNIVGIKETSGNIFQMMDMIHAVLPVRPDFSIMSGDDSLAFSLMALGGHGVYSVLSNVCPSLIKNLCHSALNGEMDKARAIHYQLLPLMKHLFVETNPMPVKAAMNILDLQAGPCRLPLCNLSDIHKEKLEFILDELFVSTN